MDLLLTRRLILASASPRRAELLKFAGLTFEIMPSRIDESLAASESPEEHVLRLSREKAQAVGDQYPEACVLGADTIVLIEENILGKPADPSEARQMLKRLSGCIHEVYTGFTIMNKTDQVMISQAVKSRVTFRDIPDEEIAWYVSTREPYDKAGAYAVQGLGAFFIREIHGSYTNVMGLPLCEVVDVLKKENFLIFSKRCR
jgi:septum formation protein